MSVALWRWRWQWFSQRLGVDDPRVRRCFGRYVAARGGTLSPAAGAPAYTAWLRTSSPGALNRSYRRHRPSP